LLSITEAVADDTQGLRGYLTIGGRSVARHQLGLALALGCTRIVVVTEALTSEVIALQQASEAGGARFHVITSAHALLPLVTADDELIVLGDGLLAQPAIALAQLGEAVGVLALPVETGMAAGFERIDINHAYAGAMRVPGRLVAGLGDLPPEWNAHAALLRLAVQGRVPLRLLPTAALDDGRWIVIHNEAGAHAFEPVWLRLHLHTGPRRSPGEWIARRTVQLAGPAMLHAGTRPWVVLLGGLVALLLGLGSGWFGWRTPGFGLLAMAWALARVAALMTRIERQSLLETGKPSATGPWFDLAVDAGFVTMAAWRSDIVTVSGVPLALVWPFASTWFAPLVAMLLLHLLPQVMPDRRDVWWLHDRLVLGIGLALVSALLPFDVCLRVGVLGMIVWAIIVTRRLALANPDLTSDG
jgi:hypothetical protein